MSATPNIATRPPRELFPQTSEERIALARQKFFEDGVRPSGTVGEAVIQSWMRCLAARRQPNRPLELAFVTPSREHSVLVRSRELLEASRPDLITMETSLGGTACRIFLTDGDGVIVHASQSTADARKVTSMVHAGVNFAESSIGTNATGVVIKTGRAATVVAGEHFYEMLAGVQCAAAPIWNAQGQLAGVLDVTVEDRRFGFHAASMVGLYAARIENRLLQMQSPDNLVVRFQADPHLLYTPLEGLAGVDAKGVLRWLNAVGAQLLAPQPEEPQTTEALFGLGLSGLLALTRQPPPSMLRLPSGLGVWLQVGLQKGDGVNFNHGIALDRAPQPERISPLHGASGGSVPLPLPLAPTAAPATLDAHSRQVIEATLAECGGNISRAARELGVSRGLLYRRLRSAEEPSAPGCSEAEQGNP